MSTHLRVLVVHNRYRAESPSGENRVVDRGIDALARAGVPVEAYLRSSDEIADMGLFGRRQVLAAPFGIGRAIRELEALIDKFRPTLLHLHNPYPLISPAVVDLAIDRRVVVVQTVHNYRHACLAGTLFRDGAVCENCLGRRLPIPGVVHGCYRGSRPQSLVMAAAQLRHRGIWARVNRYLAVSKFVAEYVSGLGIPDSRIEVVPNPVDDPGPTGPPGRGFLYAGRLSDEKGLPLLLDAWQHGRLHEVSTLVVAGDGPARAEAERRITQTPGVTYAGRLLPDEVARKLARSAAVVVPSVWYEGFPTTIVEAFAHGRPVVASAIGSLSGIVDDRVGWLASPSAEAWAATLREVATSAGEVRHRGANARTAYDRGGFADPTPMLIAAYERAVRAAEGRP